ncbi:MAG TPA: efflux RND transporter periplasmic adaptor subunit, partial [Planctomycetaceae bacterium]|nr:efflux RND transporter periplasmic adaptor subunit [Planctomycetaceae bacterium]
GGGGEPPGGMKDESLSTWPLAAPMSGTVEEVPIAPLERVKQGDDLMLVADTTHLYVQADIREKDWGAIHVAQGQMIEVQSPALAGRRLEAKVSYMGRSVIVESRAVPLIAEIDNPDGLLRPGMFVRVALPEAKPREVVAIPEGAVVSHEGRVMVFVAAGEREFEAREIKTGIQEGGTVEVVAGLQPGEKVVMEGAFVLKSELLLEPEE